MYSSSRVKIITMPEVVPGNKIDYSAKISATQPDLPRTFYKNYSISMPVPAKMIRYQLIIPKGVVLNIQNQNTDLAPKIEEQGKYIIYTWEKENNDKFEFEEYMPAYGDVWAGINISTLKDWPAIDSWYWGLVSKNIKASPAIKAKVKELIAGLSADKEKAQSIIKYMQDNIRYVSMSFDEYNYEPHAVEEVYLNKYGDCKDQTVLAITMLNEAGITAYPCLFREEKSGDMSGQLPMPLYFNHVILGVVLDGNIVYTDVLFKGYRLDETPLDIQGAYLIVINGQGGKFDRLPIVGEKENSMRNFFSILSAKSEGVV
jgi:transglutaminase-like putative cysteine protease